MISIKALPEKLMRLAESVNLKNILSKGLGGSVLLFITFMTIILSIENYRSEKTVTPPEYENQPAIKESSQKAGDDFGEQPTTVNLGVVQNTDILIEQMEKRSDNSDTFDFPLITEEILKEYKITWDSYDGETCKFFRADTSGNEVIPDYLNITINGSVQKAVFVVMGYIFAYTEDENLQMMNHSGEKLLGNLRDRKFQMQNQRDKNGNPVILDENGYSIFDMEQKTLVESDFDPSLDGRGLIYSYSRDFGEPVNSGLVRFYSESYKKWGYKNIETDEVVIAPAYNEAYNFNNGYAVAIKYEYKRTLEDGRWVYVLEKRMYFLDESGKVLNYNFYAPATLFKSKIGYLYFDRGLTRALAKEYYWYGIKDEFPYLCYPDGTIFQTPPDYTVAGYSNGMILLEKAGKYGFMDYKGNWVVQPIYSYAVPFNEGVAVVGLSDTQKALIDINGNLLTNFDYQHITDCSDGVIAMYSSENEWIILNKMKQQ